MGSGAGTVIAVNIIRVLATDGASSVSDGRVRGGTRCVCSTKIGVLGIFLDSFGCDGEQLGWESPAGSQLYVKLRGIWPLNPAYHQRIGVHHGNF